MFQRKQKRFRRRSNDRNHMGRSNGISQSRLRTNSYTNGQSRNKFRTPLSAEKLFEKYSSLAKEALTTGDKTLSENYLQHADHFMRIIEEKNKFRNQNKVNFDDKKNTETNKVQEVTNSTNNDNSENSQN
tara:strand:+ start:195 stop:584 length:390 start_codon:yes stop_codon:yes gene_type:complete